uniref:collagen alpha-1(XXI) chain-like n=1 Tax=Gasterosteus aculeatus aculeatus TaxID=481459 RepID=UPI001A98BFFA|nr:collagen alpha-1(XXI) chain-like [Gasterosteus aculeatus aculeatus]
MQLNGWEPVSIPVYTHTQSLTALWVFPSVLPGPHCSLTVSQTGRAIKFAVDHVFASSNRARQVKNRIAVVVTDGKSQDDVVDASVEARAQGITVFAVGVGSEITTSELVSIANRPSSA